NRETTGIGDHISTLELVRIEEFIYSSRGFPSRPPQDRTAIARAFVTKRGKQASCKAAARKYGFLEVPFRLII
ncbi:MAG: hypothetical protein Q8K59_02390, partial [Nitrosomonas sp.]|nr:hypothetical protein [Nitrosomonas sp.]